LRSLDGQDIRSAKQVALMPLAPGTVGLARTATTSARRAEWSAGTWTPVGEPLRVEGGERQVSVAVDEVLRGQWILLTAAP